MKAFYLVLSKLHRAQTLSSYCTFLLSNVKEGRGKKNNFKLFTAFNYKNALKRY